MAGEFLPFFPFGTFDLRSSHGCLALNQIRESISEEPGLDAVIQGGKALQLCLRYAELGVTWVDNVNVQGAVLLAVTAADTRPNGGVECGELKRDALDLTTSA